jgi:phasin family protein
MEFLMFPNQEQFFAATKANFEAQLASLANLNKKVFEGVEQVIALNLNAAKATLEESTAAAQQLAAAKDAQEFLQLSTAQAKPSAEKALAYGRHLASIASATQAEITKAAEAHIAETNTKVIALIDELSKNAPAGSEQAISALKSVIGNVNAGYEQLNKTGKQAVQTLEENLATLSKNITQAAEKATTATRSKK